MFYRDTKTPFGAPRGYLMGAISYALDRALNISALSMLQPVRPNPRPFSMVIPVRWDARPVYPGHPLTAAAAGARPNPRGFSGLVPWSQILPQNIPPDITGIAAGSQ